MLALVCFVFAAARLRGELKVGRGWRRGVFSVLGQKCDRKLTKGKTSTSAKALRVARESVFHTE